MMYRRCDNCNKEITDGDEWVRLEYRKEVDANKPSVATADLCIKCFYKFKIPLMYWK